MKKIIYVIIIFVSIFSFRAVDAASLASRLKGRILLQVDSQGQAWYVNPVEEKRIFLGRPADAFVVMRELALGVSGETFKHFSENAVPERLKGRILLNVDDFGRAYYVNPENRELIYLGRPVDALRVMRELGLGISNEDIDKIPISEIIVGAKRAFLAQTAGFEKQKPMKIADLCLSEAEADLAKRINDYRELQGLSRIPVSKSLSLVARVHLKDLVDNNPVVGKCNAHSWSNKGTWTSCCYPEETTCIQNKARELTDYTGDVVENIHWWDDAYYTPSPEGALNGWINSHGHYIVIVNAEWAKNFTWRALGVAIYKNYAAMWVGEEEDPAGEPETCTDCLGFIDPEWEYNCYANQAIDKQDKQYCEYINNETEKADCKARTDIFSCSQNYDTNDFDCYKNLIKEDVSICDYLYKQVDDQENCRNFSNRNN